MKTFEFKSQVVTSIEQSKRLLKLGFKKETADMAWVDNALTGDYEDWKVTLIENLDDWDSQLPAWSLHRLIEMMSKKIRVGDSIASLIVSNEKVQYYLHDVEYSDYLKSAGCWKYGNIYDNIIACIEWLINEGYFNKEYLEE